MTDVIVGLVSLALGGAVGFFFERMRRGAAYKDRDAIVAQAQLEADNLKRTEEIAAKEIVLKRREELDREMNKVRDQLRDSERQLDKRESSLKEQQDDMGKKDRLLQANQTKVAERLKVLEARDKELERLLRDEQEQLYKISGLDKETAKSQLLDRLGRELKNETGTLILKHEAELRDQAETKAREIIGMAVQRCASTHTSELAVSTVDIPNDEMKGRIIGRDGRNIRAFEKAAGVDVIVDDTPGVVVVSSFDKVRREIARQSLVKLLVDGRIHPTRIEEVVAETT